jgi:hypothetical protein
MKKEPKVILFCDASSGQYIPQRFAQEIDRDAVDLYGFNPSSIDECLEICAQGPDNEYYWDAWADLLDSLVVRIKSSQQTFCLYQDGDLWLIDETAEPGKDHELWEADA